MSSYYFDGLLSERGLRHGTSSRHDRQSFAVTDPHWLEKNPLVIPEEEEHRRYFLTASGMGEQPLNFLKQVHGDRVVLVEKDSLPKGLEGDALITAVPNQPVGVYTADCVPVILYDPETHSTGVAHAGRAGTEKGIVSVVIKKMKECFSVDPANLKVAIGPSIGPCCYEVGEDCVAVIKKKFDGWRGWIREHKKGKALLDLWKANQEQAIDEGVQESRIFLSGECTACENERWYSYRKEGGRAGRMLTAAMLCRR